MQKTHPNRSGCSVTEVLVALTLFTVGILALASASAVVVRRVYNAHALSAAAAIGASRLAQVAAAACGTDAGGSANHPYGITESWTTSSAGAGLARARVSLHYAHSTQTFNLESVVPCR